MPYIVITNWFPSNKAMEAAEKYLEERKKYPRDRSLGKMVVEALKSDERGIVGFSVINVKEGKLEESLLREQNIQVMYHDIEGYRYKIDVWWNITEALAMVGMKAPED